MGYYCKRLSQTGLIKKYEPSKMGAEVVVVVVVVVVILVVVVVVVEVIVGVMR